MVKEKPKKKKKIIIIILLLLLGIAILFNLYLYHKEKEFVDSTPQIIKENYFTVLFQEKEEPVEFCNYNKVEYFQEFYDENVPFQKKSFDNLYGSKKGCPGTVKSVQNHFVFEPQLQVMKNVKDTYTLNALPENIKAIDKETIQTTKNGYFLIGYDIEDNSSEQNYFPYLLKYNIDNTLEWTQKIDTTNISNDASLSVTIYGVVEKDGVDSVLYAVSYQNDEEQENGTVHLYLANFDQDGKIIATKKVMDTSFYYLKYLGILHDQFLLQQEDSDSELYSYFVINNLGEIHSLFQTELNEKNSYVTFAFQNEEHLYEVVSKEESTAVKSLSRLNQYDENGNLLLSIDFTKQEDIQNFYPQTVFVKGQYLFLYNDEELFIYHSNGQFIKKETIEDNAFIQIDYDSTTKQYYKITELEDTSKIEVYDSSLNKKHTYSYEQDKKVTTFFQNGKLYTTSFTEMNEKSYQVLATYTFQLLSS